MRVKVYCFIFIIFLLSCLSNKKDIVPPPPDKKTVNTEYCNRVKSNILQFSRDKEYVLNLVVDLSIYNFQSYDCSEKFDEYIEKHYNLRSYISGDTLFNRCNKEICDSLIEVQHGEGAVKRITFEALKYAIQNCDNSKKDY